LIQTLLESLSGNGGHWSKSLFLNENLYDFGIAKHISGQSTIKWAERIIEKIV
jgi:hypothetical protein